MLATNRYTAIEDSQIIEKTGKTSADWDNIISDLGGKTVPGSEICQNLIDTYGLSKYWARTLYIRYQWTHNLRSE